MEQWLEPDLEVWLARPIAESRTLDDAEALIMRLPHTDRLRYAIEPRWAIDD